MYQIDEDIMKVRRPCSVNYTIQPSQYKTSFTRMILGTSETPPEDERNDINFKQLSASKKEKQGWDNPFGQPRWSIERAMIRVQLCI